MPTVRAGPARPAAPRTSTAPASSEDEEYIRRHCAADADLDAPEDGPGSTAPAGEEKPFACTDMSEWETLGADGIEGVFSGGLFPRGTVGLCVGEPGAGKTEALIQAAVTCTTAYQTLAQLHADGPGKALLALAEDGPEIAATRLRATCDGCPVPVDAVDAAIREGRLVFRCLDPAPLFQSDGMGGLVRSKGFAALEKQASEGWNLLGLDPFIAYSGMTDENSNAQMAIVMAGLVHLARVANGCVFVTHHTSKARNAEKHQYAGRGAVQMVAAARTVILLTVPNEDRRKTLDLLPHERAIEWTWVKSNYGELPPPQVLLRGPGGVLLSSGAANLGRRSAIIGALVDILTSTGARFTRRELSGFGGKVAQEIRDALKDRTGRELSRSALEHAIDAGLRDGDLVAVPTPTAGRARVEILPPNERTFGLSATSGKGDLPQGLNH